MLLSQKTKDDLKLFFKGFRKGFLDFGQFMASIVNGILLSLAYFVGVGLTSLVAKIFNKHFLATKFFPEDKTYWSDLNLKERDIKEHYRQF